MALREYQCREKANVLQNTRQELRLEPRARIWFESSLEKMLSIFVLVEGPFLKEKGGRRVGKREKRRGKRREEGGKARRGGRRKEEGGKGKKRGERKEEREGKEKKKRKRGSANLGGLAAAHAFTVFFFIP